VGHDTPPTALAFSPDGCWLASGSRGVSPSNSTGEIKIWNVESGEVFCTLGNHAGPVTTLQWSPDGH